MGRLPTKRKHSERHIPPILTALNAMKFVISIMVLVLFVALTGSPHPKPDPLSERRLPGVTSTAYAESLPKPKPAAKVVQAPKPAQTAPATPTPAAAPTPPTCPDTQWIWAQDGQCHDKPVQAAPVAAAAPANGASAGCGDNSYANFIYMHESGCRTNAVNEIGACGIGQANPCSKMPCSLSDYACQNQFFTNYAMQRYGSWEAAYNYWVAHRVW
jgi:hypothetical protein